MSDFHLVESTRALPVYADQRWCWQSNNQAEDGEHQQVLAAAFQGRPVYFEFSETSQPVSNNGKEQQHWGDILHDLLVIIILIVGIPLARYNLRNGRSDRKGALKLAGTVLLLRICYLLLYADHVADLPAEFQLFSTAVGLALMETAIVWIFYMALEVYVRRLWPDLLISWGRLLTNRWRDAMIGRDILIGVLVGLLWMMLFQIDLLLPGWLGYKLPLPEVDGSLLASLLGNRIMVALSLDMLLLAIYNALFCLLLLLLLRALFKRPQISLVAFVMLLGTYYTLREGNNLAFSWLTYGLVLTILTAWLMVRFGLVALVTAFWVNFLLLSYPITHHFTVWYAGSSIFVISLILALAFYGFFTALAGRPLAPILFANTITPQNGINKS